MPDEGNIGVLERDNIAPADDNIEQPSVEAESAAEVEAGAVQDEVEAADDGESDEPLSREEHLKILNGERQKLEKSFRDKEENARKESEARALEASYAQRIQAGQAYLGQQSQAEIRQLVKMAAEQGLDEVPEDAFLGAKTRLGNATFDLHHALYRQAVDQRFEQEFGGFRPSTAVRQAMDNAGNRFHPQGQMAALFDAIREAVTADLTPKLKEQLRKEAASAAESAKLAATKRTPSPTSGGAAASAAGRKFTTQLQIDTALQNREIDWPTAKALTAKGLPYR